LGVGETLTIGQEADPLAGGRGGPSRPENKRFKLTPAISVRNVLNPVNPKPVIGDINSPLSGKSNQLASGIGAFDNSASSRRIEFHFQLGFYR